MDATITSPLDQAIEDYKLRHAGSDPLYCIMSAEEADELTGALRRSNGEDDNIIITTYRDIKIIRNNFMESGHYFLSNELPETGS